MNGNAQTCDKYFFLQNQLHNSFEGNTQTSDKYFPYNITLDNITDNRKILHKCRYYISMYIISLLQYQLHPKKTSVTGLENPLDKQHHPIILIPEHLKHI